MPERYEYTGTLLYRSDGNEVEKVERGDVIEPTESELDSFGDSLRPLGQAETVDEPDTADETATETSTDDAEESDAETSEAPIDPSEYTIDELDEEIAEGDYSKAAISAILEAEQSGDDRNGAVDTIQAHLDA